jgi:hypothetical protein
LYDQPREKSKEKEEICFFSSTKKKFPLSICTLFVEILIFAEWQSNRGKNDGGEEEREDFSYSHFFCVRRV